MNRIAALLLCLPLSCFAQSSPQQLMQQALEAQQAGRFEEAVRDYRILSKQYPNIFEIRSNLGAALAGEGQYAEAIAEYEKALSIRSNPEVRLNLALAYYKSSNLQKAIEILKQVHAEEPANLQAVELLGDSYLQLGQNRNAITLLTPLQTKYPENDAITYLLGTALVRDGQAVKAQKVINRILKNNDTAETRMLMGTTEYMARDYDGARADLQKAIQLNPSLPEVYTYYGKTLLDSGDRQGAREAFEKELQIDPNDFLANLELGILLRQSADYPGALKCFRHALDLHPGDPGVRFEIASIEFAQGQVQEAGRDFESLVKDHPDFREAIWQLANVYMREGRRADGERERAIYRKLNAAGAAQVNHPLLAQP